MSPTEANGKEVKDDIEQFAVSTLPASVTAAELNERSRQFWERPVGEIIENG
jgi:hypothetical protein